MQIICTTLQTNNHASTPSLNFYGLDALPDAQPIVSQHWRQSTVTFLRNNKHNALLKTITNSVKALNRLSLATCKSVFICNTLAIKWIILINMSKNVRNHNIISVWQYIPRSQVYANCIVLPPTPQNASMIRSHWQRFAIWRAILSGVTENQPSNNTLHQVRNSDNLYSPSSR